MAFGFIKVSSLSTSLANGGTITFSGGNVLGDTIVVFLYCKISATDLVTGVSDSQGNVYGKIAGGNFRDLNNQAFCSVWLAPVTVGGSGTNTLTISLSSGTVMVQAAEYSGVKSSSSFDTSAGGSQVNSYTITPAGAGELLVSSWGYQGGGVTWSSVTENIRSANPGLFILADILSSSAGANTVSTSNNGGALPGSITVALLPASTGAIGWTNRHRNFINKRNMGIK